MAYLHELSISLAPHRGLRRIQSTMNSDLWRAKKLFDPRSRPNRLPTGGVGAGARLRRSGVPVADDGAAGAGDGGVADAVGIRSRWPKAGSGQPVERRLHAVSRRYWAIRTDQRTPSREGLLPGACAEASAFPQRHMPSRSQAISATGLAR